MKRTIAALCGLFALSALSACGDLPDPASLITKARVLGLLSSVEGDDTRSAAEPGETLNLELILTQKAARGPNTYAFIVCEPQVALLGVATCRPGVRPVGVFMSAAPTDAPPRFAVTIPEGTEQNLLLLGAICMGGQVRTDLMSLDMNSSLNPCVGEGVGQIMTGTVLVQDPEREVNHVPTMEEIWFDELIWSAEPPDELTGCATSDLPQVSLADITPHLIEVVPTPGSRESFLDPRAAPPGPDVEDLPVAFYATELGVSGLYSVVDANPGEEFQGATPVANVDFTTEDIEEEPDAAGRVIRFEIVMRDDRGGVSHASRALCLVP